MRPSEHRAHRTWAVVGAQHLRSPRLAASCFEHPCHREATKRSGRHNRYGLGVASSTMVRHFSIRPSAVRSKTKSADSTSLRWRGRSNGWRSGTGTFFRHRPFHLEARFGVQPIDALMIDHAAFLRQLQIDHARAIAAVPMRQGDDAIT